MAHKHTCALGAHSHPKSFSHVILFNGTQGPVDPVLPSFLLRREHEHLFIRAVRVAVRVASSPVQRPVLPRSRKEGSKRSSSPVQRGPDT